MGVNLLPFLATDLLHPSKQHTLAVINSPQPAVLHKHPRSAQLLLDELEQFGLHRCAPCLQAPRCRMI